MLLRKKPNYKFFEEIEYEIKEGKLDKNTSNIQNCSICSLTLCIGEGENIQLVVYPHLYDLFEPKFFPFTKQGYNQAIDYYQEQINEYLSKIEEEYYVEENGFSRLINTSIF